jgi:excisionase family DNA binding protein
VAEAGEMLGISWAFAYELVARGELPVIRLGRRRLVPKAGLLALVGQTEPALHPARPDLSRPANHRQDGGALGGVLLRHGRQPA